MKEATLGRIMLENAIPKELRPHLETLNKKGISNLFSLLATQHPEKYREVSKKLADVANLAGYDSGSYSFGHQDMIPHPETQAIRDEYNAKVHAVLNDTSLGDKERNGKLIQIASHYSDPIQESIMKHGRASKNPLAMQVESGAKGKAENMKALVAGDSLYTDSQYKPVPYPILHSFAEGLTPAEFASGSFGARLAIVLTKLGTASGGYLSKRLNNLAHRLVVTANDSDKTDTSIRGLPSKVSEPDNEGALLAHEAGGFPKNTTLTREVINNLKRQGVDDILVRSPMVGGPENGGVYGRDVGVRERQKIAPVGDFVGLAAASSIGEPLSQLIIGSKHSGGVAGATKTQEAFPVIDRLFSVPSSYIGGAAHAKVDGKVEGIKEAPQGGHFIYINGEQHYAHPDQKITVKPHDVVEEGDPLTDGILNPNEFVPAKGIGEGRRLFVNTYMNLSKEAGLNPNRRNVELVARGYIDHVKMDKEVGSLVPGDVSSYTWLENNYEPREGHTVTEPKAAVGRYLEKPVLHYSIGTKVKPSMLPHFQKWGVTSLTTHEDEPPFHPIMIRSQDTPSYDSDWMSRMLGSGLEKSLLKGVHRGAISDPQGTSYVPALAEGINFGEKGKTIGWNPS